VERPGTGPPDVKPMDPDEPRVTPTVHQQDFSDNLYRVLQMGMADLRIAQDGYGRPIVCTFTGVETWFVPDPKFVAMLNGDKYSLAFHQMYDSGVLGAEFEDALAALFGPEAVLFFAALLGAQFVPGLNVIVDAGAFGVLLLTVGDLTDQFLDAMAKVAKAINKQQFDRATQDLARVLAAIGTGVLVALVAAVGGKVVKSLKAGATDEVGAGTGRAPKNPELNQGGVHEALKGKNPEFTKGGVHDALPADPPPKPRPFRPRAEATGPGHVPAADDPVGYLNRTYPPDIAGPAADAYRLAAEGLGGQVDGVVGSYAKGCPKVGAWPVGTADEALILSKIPAELSPEAVESLPTNVRRIYDLRVQLGAEGIPSDLDVLTTETDPDKLAALRQLIFERTGIYVEFVEAP
jgi:hypothetical protein